MSKQSTTGRTRKCTGIVITVVVILLLMLLFLIFRDRISDFVRNLMQPIGPGGLPPEKFGEWN